MFEERSAWALVTVFAVLGCSVQSEGGVRESSFQDELQIETAADATIREGIGHASKNFGDERTLSARNSTTAGETRWAYLKFEIPPLERELVNATLVLSSDSPDATEPVSVAVYGVESTHWEEHELTWNRRPASGTTPLDRALVSAASETSEWNVTEYLRGELGSGRQVVAFALKVRDSDSPEVRWRAREVGGSVPRLLIETADKDRTGPMIAGCPVFPPDNAWNQSVLGAPIDPNSERYLKRMGADSGFLHPDFGSDPSYGIPWTVVRGDQPAVPMTFKYQYQSDPGPYPFPPDAPVEGGVDASGDRHVIVIDRDNCLLYETWDSHFDGAGWSCGSGARFDLRSNTLRRAGWTSADAAGLPIFPGLVRRDEVLSGAIRHALRFTLQETQRGYVEPATHHASTDTDPDLPPMGLRLRLRASYDISGFNPTARVILQALKEYGMILADNGSDFYLSGEANPAWNDAALDQLTEVPMSAFEVVKHGPVQR